MTSFPDKKTFSKALSTSRLPEDKEGWYEVMTTPEGELAGPLRFNALRREMGYDLLDLSGLDFTGKDLCSINLSNTLLRGCFFDFATLTEASFIMAQMDHCSAREAAFFMAQMEEVDLSYADLTGADFSSACLADAVFDFADAQGALFVESDLSKASFKHALLNDADFSDATLNGTNFTDANGEWAILPEGRRLSAPTYQPPEEPEEDTADDDSEAED